jgi:nitroreductase
VTVSELIRTQRATRQYTGEPVSDEAIRAILQAGRRAQSSKNTQPWQFIVVRDRETLQKLSECGKYAAHVPHAAFVIALVTSVENGFDLGQAAAYLQLAAWERGIGSCITSMHESAKAKEVLGIPQELYFSTVLAFGYPKPEEQARPARKNGRKPLDEVVRWEHW